MLGPGLHCSTSFTPRLCLTVSSGWQVLTEIPNEVLLSDRSIDFGGVSFSANLPDLADRFETITISRPSIFAVPCSKDQEVGAGVFKPVTTPIGPRKEDFIDWLRASRALEASEPVPSQIGGLDGIVIDVSSSGTCESPGRQIVFMDYYNQRYGSDHH